MHAHEGVKKSSHIDLRTMKELVECLSIMHAWKFLKKSELKFVSFILLALNLALDFFSSRYFKISLL